MVSTEELLNVCINKLLVSLFLLECSLLLLKIKGATFLTNECQELLLRIADTTMPEK